MSWLAGLGGIAGAIGGFLNNNNSLEMSWDMMLAQQQFNAEQAKIQRDWQERMRETQYQTTMEDMKKGGLNPILAGNLGGAGVPSGGTASAGLQSPPRFENFLATGISSAVQLLGALNNASLVEAQVDKVRAEEKLTNEQAVTQAVTRDSLIADIAYKGGQTLSDSERRELTASEVLQRRASAGASGAAAAASMAGAGLDIARTATERLQQQHYGKRGGFIAPEQGWGGPLGIRTPPGGQVLPNNPEVLNQALRVTKATSGLGVAASTDTVRGLSQMLAEEVIAPILRNLGRRATENHGTDRLSTMSGF